MEQSPNITTVRRTMILAGRAMALARGAQCLSGLNRLVNQATTIAYPARIDILQLKQFVDGSMFYDFLVRKRLISQEGVIPRKILDKPYDLVWVLSPKIFSAEKSMKNPDDMGILSNIYLNATTRDASDLNFDFENDMVGDIHIGGGICKAMISAGISQIDFKAGFITPKRYEQSLKCALRFLSLGAFPEEGPIVVCFPYINRHSLVPGAFGAWGWDSSLEITRVDKSHFEAIAQGSLAGHW
ncbi:MAG: hypothetical protein WC527_05930 [Candidatus Margulisiibacteriota bacterium]